MGLVERRTLIARISPPLDELLATQLVDEFVSMERRFIQRDWEPAELDGGQFCEVLARALYHQDSGNLNQAKELDDCLKYIEHEPNSHALARRDALRLARVLRTVYKFRSQRGAVHISPSYSPNHMDAKYVIEAVRWAMMETLRIFWGGDRERVAKAIRELLQFDVPCVGVFQDVLLVQRTDLPRRRCWSCSTTRARRASRGRNWAGTASPPRPGSPRRSSSSSHARCGR